MKIKWWISLFIIVAVLLISIPVAAASPGEPPGLAKAIAAQEKHNPELLSQNGVVGTAVGLDNGQPVVQVLVENHDVRGLPSALDGVPVQVLVTGKITAIGPAGKGKPSQNTVNSTGYFPRPVPIGVSTGNANEISAGTIGARLKDSSGKIYALSNNHVYALENDASIGDNILQPGRYDGAQDTPYYQIGTLAAFMPISFTSDNIVDVAVASSSLEKLGNSTPSNGYGTPSSSTKVAAVNMAVQKYGRTSQLTKGTVTGINATITVSYSNGNATFVGQIVVQSKGLRDRL